MKVAVIQVDTVWENRDANFAQIAPLVSTAVKNGATFILLTEMFSTGFVVDRSDIGEPEGGPSSQFLSKMATQHNVWIGGSCPEVTNDDPRPFNSFVLVSPQGKQHRYHKIHPFTYGGEDTYFRPGTEFVSLFLCVTTFALPMSSGRPQLIQMFIWCPEIGQRVAGSTGWHYCEHEP